MLDLNDDTDAIIYLQGCISAAKKYKDFDILIDAMANILEKRYEMSIEIIDSNDEPDNDNQ